MERAVQKRMWVQAWLWSQRSEAVIVTITLKIHPSTIGSNVVPVL